MKVIYGIGKVKKVFKNTVLAIGVFDGLHIGHQKLIKSAVQRAKALRGTAIVMTFSPHPVQVLKPDRYLPFIVSLPHRLKLIERLGAVRCVVVHFTKRFSRLTADQFIKNYLMDRIRPVEVFVGKDFRFGKNRSGTIEYFKKAGGKYGFKVNAIAAVNGGGGKIGSSRIRQLITEGKLSAAKHYLGRCVSVMGKVVKGDGRGKLLGFPTANINVINSVIPPVGVYAVRVIVGDKRFNGMANIGQRPSFNSGNGNINIEVHLFHFNQTLYAKDITVQFVRKIRNEKKFNAKEKLIAQLRRDQARSKAILRS